MQPPEHQVRIGPDNTGIWRASAVGGGNAPCHRGHFIRWRNPAESEMILYFPEPGFFAHSDAHIPPKTEIKLEVLRGGPKTYKYVAYLVGHDDYVHGENSVPIIIID